MSGNLEQFGAYQKAIELFDLVVADMGEFLGDRRLERLVSQQIASADSVCSNIEEGYGRESTPYSAVFRSSPADPFGKRRVAMAGYDIGFRRRS